MTETTPGPALSAEPGIAVVLEDCATKIRAATGDERLARMFLACMRNTLDTTISRDEDGSTFVITGDIPAMWLRDSSAQMRPFLPLVGSTGALFDVVAGLVRRQFAFINHDSYANAFNREPNGASYDPDDACDDPWIWERKYEIDSLAFPVQLAHQLWRASGRTDFLTLDVHQALATIVEQWRTEQDHRANSPYRFERATTLASETLSDGGLGAPVAVTGMTWGGFRPSDDACVYGYNIPANHFAHLALGHIAELASEVFDDARLAASAAALAGEIAAGIAAHGVVEHPEHGPIHAYEVDGMGGVLLMDDANMPSLLSLPLTSAVPADDRLYLATRRFILGPENPYFNSGSFASGIGSPHTPPGYIWHIALAVQGLTSGSRAEELRMLELLRDTDGGTGFLHEGFDPADPTRFTRPWFSWANSMFCELALKYAGVAV
ncbi:glycoside hydrolase family 125 protein [Arthrobacter sp. 35W]|uniref:glycoside hydrolase family 125 protein n=1 Tax=Arthrobacter sp. 35W TaxID=1132441 RepID=UPI000479103E|nr:glycoside hydrolase family 125 protein [Arthrobacter sp. 35W]